MLLVFSSLLWFSADVLVSVEKYQLQTSYDKLSNNYTQLQGQQSGKKGFKMNKQIPNIYDPASFTVN